MKVLNDIELHFLHKMLDVEFDFDSWRCVDYDVGCTFIKIIDGLEYNVWYSGSVVQLDIYESTYASRLAIRLNDVAYDFDNKKIIYRNKVYSKNKCTIVGTDPLDEEVYNKVLQVLNKLELITDAWKPYRKDE